MGFLSLERKEYAIVCLTRVWQSLLPPFCDKASQFKVLLLVYKALNGLAPKYIKELLVPYKPRRHLRSEAKGLQDEQRTRLKFGDRAFSISAPRLWNALPQHLKDSTSCQAFKKCLKTHLFRLAHWGVADYDSNYDNVKRFWTFYEWKRRYINSNYYYYYYYCKMCPLPTIPTQRTGSLVAP